MHRIISELFQLLERPSIQIVDLFPCLVKRSSDSVSALIVLLLHASWKRIEFFLTHCLTINDRDYCDSQLSHSYNVPVDLCLFVEIAEDLVALCNSLLRNAIPSRDELFVLECGGNRALCLIDKILQVFLEDLGSTGRKLLRLPLRGVLKVVHINPLQRNRPSLFAILQEAFSGRPLPFYPPAPHPNT